MVGEGRGRGREGKGRGMEEEKVTGLLKGEGREERKRRGGEGWKRRGYSWRHARVF